MKYSQDATWQTTGLFLSVCSGFYLLPRCLQLIWEKKRDPSGVFLSATDMCAVFILYTLILTKTMKRLATNRTTCCKWCCCLDCVHFCQLQIKVFNWASSYSRSRSPIVGTSADSMLLTPKASDHPLMLILRVSRLFTQSIIDLKLKCHHLILQSCPALHTSDTSPGWQASSSTSGESSCKHRHKKQSLHLMSGLLW